MLVNFWKVFFHRRWSLQSWKLEGGATDFDLKKENK